MLRYLSYVTLQPYISQDKHFQAFSRNDQWSLIMKEKKATYSRNLSPFWYISVGNDILYQFQERSLIIDHLIIDHWSWRREKRPIPVTYLPFDDCITENNNFLQNDILYHFFSQVDDEKFSIPPSTKAVEHKTLFLVGLSNDCKKT